MSSSHKVKLSLAIVLITMTTIAYFYRSRSFGNLAKHFNLSERFELLVYEKEHVEKSVWLFPYAGGWKLWRKNPLVGYSSIELTAVLRDSASGREAAVLNVSSDPVILPPGSIARSNTFSVNIETAILSCDTLVVLYTLSKGGESNSYYVRAFRVGKCQSIEEFRPVGNIQKKLSFLQSYTLESESGSCVIIRNANQPDIAYRGEVKGDSILWSEEKAERSTH